MQTLKNILIIQKSVIYVDNFNFKQLNRLYYEFYDYDIIKSLFFLKIAKIPSLESIIILDCNDKTLSQLKIILRCLNWKQVLLRRDVNVKGYLKPRGGFIYEIPELLHEIKKSISLGYKVILHPPYSRYNNLFSGNILYSPVYERIIIEIVTAGFDLSDISRGDLPPHEIFTFNLPSEVDDITHITPIDLVSHQIMDNINYKKTWEIRLDKVFREITKSNNNKEFSEKFNTVKMYLKGCKNEFFLKVYQEPQFIDYHNLSQIYKYFSLLYFVRNQYYLQNSELSLGFIIEPLRGLMFWNIFSGYRK